MMQGGEEDLFLSRAFAITTVFLDDGGRSISEDAMVRKRKAKRRWSMRAAAGRRDLNTSIE